MEVPVDPDVQAKLSRIAAERQCKAEQVASESLKCFVDYDEWFIQEVEKGLASANRGELLSHEAVGARLEQRLAQKQPRS